MAIYYLAKSLARKLDFQFDWLKALTLEVAVCCRKNAGSYFDSGQKVDVARVKELTQILESTGDKRAEKGPRLLKDSS